MGARKGSDLSEKYIVEGTTESADHMWISNGAYSLVSRIRELEATGEKKGITYLYMSALVLIAFTNEAHINLVGEQVFRGAWPETAKTVEKLNLLSHRLDLSSKKFRLAEEKVKGLIKLRNRLAHPKARKGTSFKKEFPAYPSDEALEPDLKPPILRQMTLTEVETQYSAMETLFSCMCDAAGIDPFEHNGGASWTVRPTPI